jgi:predicted nuclease with TOPRIM domain
VADTKKVRSLEERKEAMLAELAELEAKQLERYRKELADKGERLVKAQAQLKKYTDEVASLEARISELNEAIDGADEDDTPDEVEAFASTPLEVVAEPASA